jgi:TusA-related sulfurtransferase
MVQLDIRGQVCPNATGSVYTALRRLPDGETLVVTSDYPPARSTIPALAGQLGGTSEVRDLEDGTFVVEIRKAAERRH